MIVIGVTKYLRPIIGQNSKSNQNFKHFMIEMR